MKKPSTIEIVLALLFVAVLAKAAFYPNWKFGDEGWGEYRRVR